MFWKLGFLVIFVLGTAGYVLWAVRVAVPQIGYFTAAAAGRHVSHRVQILKVKENADDAVGGGEFYRDLFLEGVTYRRAVGTGP